MIKEYYKAEYYTGFINVQYWARDDEIPISTAYYEVEKAILERKKTFKNRQYRIVLVKEKIVYSD